VAVKRRQQGIHGSGLATAGTGGFRRPWFPVLEGLGNRVELGKDKGQLFKICAGELLLVLRSASSEGLCNLALQEPAKDREELVLGLLIGELASTEELEGEIVEAASVVVSKESLSSSLPLFQCHLSICNRATLASSMPLAAKTSSNPV